MILGIVELNNKALTHNMLAETKIKVYWWVRTFHALVCVRNFNYQNDSTFLCSMGHKPMRCAIALSTVMFISLLI